jgi:hypothetical protein
MRSEDVVSRKHEWRIVRIPAEQMGNPDAVETEFAGEVEDVQYREEDGKGTLYFSIERTDNEPYDPLSGSFNLFTEIMRAYRDDVLMGDFACALCERERRVALTCYELPGYWERMGLTPDTMSHDRLQDRLRPTRLRDS